jgi:hypothetical protein
MSFVTQPAPKVLVGLTSALPNPAGINEGFIYHATDTTASFLLVIDSVTGIHRWDPIGPAANSPIRPYLGTGALGNVVISVSDMAFDGMHDYVNLTINAGVTLRATPGELVIIRALQSITVLGTIDQSLQSPSPFLGVISWGACQGAGSGGGGGGGADNLGDNGEDGSAGNTGGQNGGLGVLSGTGIGGAGGTGGTGGVVPNGNGSPGGAAGLPTQPLPDPTQPMLAHIYPPLEITFVTPGTPGQQGLSGSQGGAGSNGAGGNGGNGGDGGNGGPGGGIILLIAPAITLGPTCVLNADGGIGTAGLPGSPGAAATPGSKFGGGGGGGGGAGGDPGCGGILLLYYQGTTGLQQSPGAQVHANSGAGSVGGAGGAGGAGDGGAGHGGAGGAGSLSGPALGGLVGLIQLV